MSTNLKKTSCFNCKHYLQYYVKENGRFVPIEYGHCKRRILTCKDVGFPFLVGCEYWEEEKKN